MIENIRGGRSYVTESEQGQREERNKQKQKKRERRNQLKKMIENIREGEELCDRE